MLNSQTPFKSSTANEDKENRLIFKALLQYKQPLTRRKLSEVIGLEIGNLCTLYNLTYKSKVLKIAQIKPCPKTRKQVFHYYFETPKPDLFTKSSSE